MLRLKNKILLGFLLSILNFVFISCSSTGNVKSSTTNTQTESQDNFKQGEELELEYIKTKYQDKNIKNEAISAYLRASTLNPEQKSDAYLAIARLYIKTENPDFNSAKKYLDKSLNENKQNDKALAFKIRFYFIKEGYRQAIKLANKILENIQSEIIELELYNIKSMYDTDINALKAQLLKLKIRNNLFYNTLAQIEYKERNFEKARYLSIKAKEFNKFDANNYMTRSLIALKYNDTYEAKLIAEKGLDIDPISADLLNTYAGILLSMGDLSGAEKPLNKAINISPANIYTINALANLKALKMENTEAKKLYQKAIDIEPDFSYTYFNYANFLLNNEKNKIKALEFYKQFVAKKIFGLNKNHRVYKIIRNLEKELN